ncbi:MAG: thioredoxin-dependent thiol peroxidase [Flavobacteriales bacterium]|nr:thioredoxin-dependent thiol peroxidase [Flavobacteriales bacterium]
MPKVGSIAPAFSALDQDSEMVSLAGLKGKKVALFFYPKDDTPTCTVEVCNLRDNHTALKKAGYKIIGVSPDGTASHKKFAAKFNLPFSLLADEGKKIVNAYGVWGPKKLYGREYEGLHRTTFLINEKGVIERLITGVRSKVHSQQILKDG